MTPVLAAFLGGLVAATITGIAQYLSAVVPARRAAAAAEATNALAAAEADRNWLTRVAEMCRSDDAAERRIGLRFLQATIHGAPTSPIGRALLTELTQEHFESRLEDTRSELHVDDLLTLLPPDDQGGAGPSTSEEGIT